MAGFGAVGLALEQVGDIEAAKALIDRTRDDDLAEMIRRFEKLRTQIRESLREIAIVLSIDGRPYAVAVDGVETVSRLGGADGDAIAEGLAGANGSLVTGSAASTSPGSWSFACRQRRFSQQRERPRLSGVGTRASVPT